MSLSDKKKMAMTGKKWEEIIPSDDFKQFIKELKEELTPPFKVNVEDMQVGQRVDHFIIDKLAGEGLI